MKTKLLQLFAILNILGMFLSSLQKQPKGQTTRKEVVVPVANKKSIIMSLPSLPSTEGIMRDGQDYIDSLKKMKPYVAEMNKNSATLQIQMLILKRQDQIINNTNKLLNNQKAFADAINMMQSFLPDTVSIIETRYIHDTITRVVQPVATGSWGIRIGKSKVAPYYKDTFMYKAGDTSQFVIRKIKETDNIQN